uniref:MARVEL domain-containing protein n=1 Tax=Timema douglasi TaxID=61478 RepID=A0A7R8VGM8_TIMDO|nr:unnamed protein product [Timema douglasi]
MNTPLKPGPHVRYSSTFIQVFKFRYDSRKCGKKIFVFMDRPSRGNQELNLLTVVSSTFVLNNSALPYFPTIFAAPSELPNGDLEEGLSYVVLPTSVTLPRGCPWRHPDRIFRDLSVPKCGKDSLVIVYMKHAQAQSTSRPRASDRVLPLFRNNLFGLNRAPMLALLTTTKRGLLREVSDFPPSMASPHSGGHGDTGIPEDTETRASRGHGDTGIQRTRRHGHPEDIDQYSHPLPGDHRPFRTQTHNPANTGLKPFFFTSDGFLRAYNIPIDSAIQSTRNLVPKLVEEPPESFGRDGTSRLAAPQHTLSKEKLPSTITSEPALREQQCSLYPAVPPSSPPPLMCACAQPSNTTSLELHNTQLQHRHERRNLHFTNDMFLGHAGNGTRDPELSSVVNHPRPDYSRWFLSPVSSDWPHNWFLYPVSIDWPDYSRWFLSPVSSDWPHNWFLYPVSIDWPDYSQWFLSPVSSDWPHKWFLSPVSTDWPDYGNSQIYYKCKVASRLAIRTSSRASWVRRNDRSNPVNTSPKIASDSGITALVEMLVFGIVCMACASPAILSGTHWFLFVVVTSFIATLIWVFVYLLGIREALKLPINWILTVSTLLALLVSIVGYGEGVWVQQLRRDRALKGLVHYITGHSPYQASSFRMNLSEIRLCCCGGEATPEHMTLECIFTKRERAELLMPIQANAIYHILRDVDQWSYLDEITDRVLKAKRDRHMDELKERRQRQNQDLRQNRQEETTEEETSEVVPYSKSPARLETTVMLGWISRPFQECRLATELVNTSILTLLYLIAFIVQLSVWSPYYRISWRDSNMAAGVFGLFNFLVYAAGVYFLFVEWKRSGTN